MIELIIFIPLFESQEVVDDVFPYFFARVFSDEKIKLEESEILPDYADEEGLEEIITEEEEYVVDVANSNTQIRFGSTPTISLRT